jgi:hypothetical protein
MRELFEWVNPLTIALLPAISMAVVAHAVFQKKSDASSVPINEKIEPVLQALSGGMIIAAAANEMLPMIQKEECFSGFTVGIVAGIVFIYLLALQDSFFESTDADANADADDKKIVDGDADAEPTAVDIANVGNKYQSFDSDIEMMSPKDEESPTGRDSDYSDIDENEGDNIHSLRRWGLSLENQDKDNVLFNNNNCLSD